MPVKRSFYPLLSGLILLGLLLGACESSTGPATEAPTATEEAAGGLAVPAASPSPVPTDVGADLALPPPRLLYRSPAPGEALPLDGHIELVFDQPMDQGSVVSAVTISPTLEGRFTWADDRSVIFAPSQELVRGETYLLSLDDAAQSAAGQLLAEPVRFTLETAGFLEVSQVQPASDTTDVGTDARIMVVFDQPVVPLRAIGQQGELPDPLTFMPPVTGRSEWLNTSIYLFTPDRGLQPATEYTARVAAGLTDTLGGVLAEDYTWRFATLRPAVLGSDPPSGFDFLDPTGPISVTFNQPMDHASVLDHFSLVLASGGEVDGRTVWVGGDTLTQTETLVFEPREPLPRGATLKGQINKGARGRYGSEGTAKDYTFTLRVAPKPAVLRTVPRNDSAQADPYGSVEITFASPMDKEVFLDHLDIQASPPVTVSEVYTYWSEYDTQVGLVFGLKPATTYTLTLAADMPGAYGLTLGEPYVLTFTTRDLNPMAYLNTNGDVSSFNVYTDTYLYATHRNVGRLDLELYTVSPDTFMRLTGDDRWEVWDKFQPQQDDLLRGWSLRVRGTRNVSHLQRVRLVDDAGQGLPPGIYYLQLSAPEVEKTEYYRPSRLLFVISPYNVLLKRTETEALAWVTDLKTGQPVVDVPVEFAPGVGGSATQATTDADGLASTAWEVKRDLWRSYYVFVGAPGEEGFGVAASSWDEGIAPWSFDLPADWSSEPYAAYFYTDRPIYRPGQTVYFKGILRADDDAQYTIPGVKTMRVMVQDVQGKEIYNETLTLNDLGTLHGQLALDEEASLGTYSLQAELGQHTFWSSFQVAEYKKPEYQVTVQTDRPDYLRGDEMAVSVGAEYFAGGAVADAQVGWSVLSADAFFQYQCPRGTTCPRYDFVDWSWEDRDRPIYGVYGELIAEGQGRTDAQGRFTFETTSEVAHRAQSQQFTIEARITDLSGQEVAARTAVMVHAAEFYAGVAPRRYVGEAGRAQTVDLIAVDWDSQPVPGETLTVVFNEHRWYSVREQAEDGRFYWTWTTEDVPVYTTTVRTSDDGTAEAAFIPRQPGSYKVLVTGQDRYENEVRTSTYLWIWGDGYASWRQDNNNRIDLIADKDEYQIGDVAEILIPSPYTVTADSPLQALVTLERGHLIEQSVITLESNSHLLRVPITVDHVPNVYLSVVLVQGMDGPAGVPSFRVGYAMLPVSVASKALTISLTPDKSLETDEHYRPREKVRYDVWVTDAAGRPVEAELSLRLADLAVLSLADEQQPSMLDYFWRQRGVGVRMAATLVTAIDRVNQELEEGAKGGDGVEDAAGLIRTRFADTAFWAADVRTDEDGRTSVEVELPDNLTTWRMQAQGITADTLVGRSDVDVLSTLDLLVRPVLPRFFVVGDRAEIATIVRNNTSKTLEAEVSVAAEGLAFDGDTRATVRVPSQGQVKVVWPATVESTEHVTIRMQAQADGLSDGREDTLPVYRYSTPEVVATAGRLPEAGARLELVPLPSAYDPAQGELTVHLDGSLAAGMQDGLDYLQHYPYECVEQTVSRFLPNVVTYRALTRLGLERPELEAPLAQQVGVGLQRLYNQQHYDGGWGWWVNDESNAYLTAYVLQGLLEAKRAGFSVDAEVMSSAAAFLKGSLRSATGLKLDAQSAPARPVGVGANRQAYVLFVLADYQSTEDEDLGGATVSRAVTLLEERHALSLYAKAYLAVAFHLLEPDETAHVDLLLSDLATAAVLRATGTHWEETWLDAWNMNSDLRSTAIVLWALARLTPDTELLPGAVRWLMAVRQDGHWETTQQTAWSLLALVEYMQATGELEGDFDYTVYLNNEVLALGQVDRTNLDETRQLRVEIADLLADRANRLVIERAPAGAGQTGQGQLYYAAYLRTYVPAERVKALNRGIVVARQYSLVDAPKQAITGAQVGDLIKVKLTIVAPSSLHYVVVEDPVPAGCEAVDTSLKTTSAVGEAPTLTNLGWEDRWSYYRWVGWGWWWFGHTDLRDEKVALFATYLPQGTYEYTYLMRASVPGAFKTLPAVAYEMYFPEVFGRSDGALFTVQPSE
jgi:uncharacterized protein YfaS (alpha-2-macroglobulin family)